MEVEFINKEQDWANETTRYWFTVLDRCPRPMSICNWARMDARQVAIIRHQSGEGV